MDVVVEFVGGPIDGQNMSSDSPDELVRKKVLLFAQIIGGCLRDMEKREVPFNPGMVYTVPSEQIMEIAKKESWSEAKIKALVRKYEYVYSTHSETDGMAVITLKYKGEV